MIIVYLIIGIILINIPYIGKYFRMFNTLIHELGHAIMALIVRGKVYRIELNNDTSGTAHTGHRGKLSGILVSLAGYPASAITSYYLIVWVIGGNYEYVLYGLTALGGISLILWVRNKFGVIWIISTLLVTWGIFYLNNETIITIYASSLVCIIFVESVKSAIVICRISMRPHVKSGDASNLEMFTKIPKGFWGILFMGIQLYYLWKVFLLIGNSMN